MTSGPDIQLCTICGQPSEAHVLPNLNHEFSLDGSLTPIHPVKPLEAEAVLGRLIKQLVIRRVLNPEDAKQVLFPGFSAPDTHD